MRRATGFLTVLCLMSFQAAAEGAPASADVGIYDVLQRNAWYLPTTDGAARLLVTEIGQGPPVMFLHGGPGNDFQYIVDALVPHLADHRFILFDDRGSLLSPVAPDRADSVTLAKMVDDLESLRVATGQARLTLFGHSFGSLLALTYFQAHPDHVECLVLTGSFPLETSLPELTAAMRPRQKALRGRPEVIATLAAEGLAGLDSSLTARQRSMKSRITGLAALNVIDLRRWRQAVGGGVYYSRDVDERVAASITGRLDFRKVVLDHPVPITIIQGDTDYIDPGASGWRAFAVANPKARIELRVVPKASHYAWIDAPGIFRQALTLGLSRKL